MFFSTKLNELVAYFIKNNIAHTVGFSSVTWFTSTIRYSLKPFRTFKGELKYVFRTSSPRNSTILTKEEIVDLKSITKFAERFKLTANYYEDARKKEKLNLLNIIKKYPTTVGVNGQFKLVLAAEEEIELDLALTTKGYIVYRNKRTKHFKTSKALKKMLKNI